MLDELRRLRAENTDLKRQNLLQGEEIRLMKLRKYGQSSEKLTAEDISQGKLFDEAELYSTANDDSTATEEVRITKTVYTRRKRGRKPLSPKLSRIEVLVDLSDEEKTVGDGFELIRIGEEVSEQVHERSLRAKYFASGCSGDLDAFASERKDTILPVFQKTDAWLTAKAIEVTPQSALGKAVSYTRDQWPRLVRYLECPYLTPDNNEAERAIRPVTIGRKNWVISGGPRGAFASATLYSFIETAKLCALEPYYYLRYVLSKLPLTEPDKIGSLLPWNINTNDFGELTAEDARISLDSIPLA